MKKINTLFMYLSVLIIFSGCATTKINYTPPENNNTDCIIKVTINESKDVVWNRILYNISQSYFVINNIEKDSGFLNISYSGDPSKYVDCGTVALKNINEAQNTTFIGNVENVEFITWRGTVKYNAIRNLKLSGRVNLLIQEISSDQTLVSVKIRYVVDETIRAHGYDTWNGHHSNDSIVESITFNSCSGISSGRSLTFGCRCISNGNFEKELKSISELK